MFVHDHEDFSALVDGAARDVGIDANLVEKDYWVTHTLWALQHAGLELWFKGGTSLSKGFGLIQRFSEDIDVKVEPGGVAGLCAPTSWTSKTKGAIESRRLFFRAIVDQIAVPGCTLDWEEPPDLDNATAAEIRVLVPRGLTSTLSHPNRPYVLLEVGNARVTPAVERDLSSWVHDRLNALSLADGFTDNRPKALRCLHPWVTAVEKLDAITRRWPRDPFDPAGFIRHYGDLHAIVTGGSELEPLVGFGTWTDLATTLGVEVDAGHPAFDGDMDPARHEALARAYAAIGPMFWGPQPSLADILAVLRDWLASILIRRKHPQ